MTQITVLVVEDEDIVSMDMLLALKNLHYSPLGAVKTGDAALEKARQQVPDIVLMDIGIPGTMDGIETARVLREELDIPVIFVTSYSDDGIIEKVKGVDPYGYIIKPFDDRDLKVAIEVALSRKNAEREKSAIKQAAENPLVSDEPVQIANAADEFIRLPEIKTLLLNDIFREISLIFYSDPAIKETLCTIVLEKYLKTGGNLLFAYSRSRAHKKFQKEIQQGLLVRVPLKPGETSKTCENLSRYCQSPETLKTIPVRFILDFSERYELHEVRAILDLVRAIRENGAPVSGIIAFYTESVDPGMMSYLSAGISRIIALTGSGTLISFPNTSFSPDSFSVVPQATLDETVKKTLEPVVLSLLEEPISGYDIMHEIQRRYHVQVPQARVYTLLYDLQKRGYLDTKMSGKSKLYYPTETGQKYIRQKLGDFRSILRHIFVGKMEGSTGGNSPNKKE
ncbi:MAG: response regulator [Methanoregulaceae archaeon]